MKNRKKKDLKIPDVLLWIYAVITIIVIPVAYYKPAVDVTLLPKFIVLLFFLSLFLIIFLLNDKYKLPYLSLFKRLPLLFWSGFLIVSIISLTAAINPTEGIFDIMKISTLLLFVVITSSVLIKNGNIKPFIVSAILCSIFLSLIGLHQYFSHAFRQPDMSTLYQIKGLMSHKNVLSCILYLLIPLLTYSALTAPIQQRVVSNISLFLNVSLLILIQTRSIWLAITAFIIITICSFFIFKKNLKQLQTKNFRNKVITTASVLVLSFSTAYIISNYSISNHVRVDDSKITERVERVDKRLSSIFDTSSPTRVKRLDIWERTIEMYGDHPVVGVGAGNWKILVPNYYHPDPDESYYHNWRRPHNDFLWVLAEKGWVGLLLYLGFFVSLYIISIQIILRNIAAKFKLLVILSVAGISGYLIDASFSFPYERVDLQVALMFHVSIIVWIRYHMVAKSIVERKSQRRVLLIISTVVLMLFINVSYKMIKSEVNTKRAYHAIVNQQWPIAIAAIDHGYSDLAKIDPTNIPVYWYRGLANLNMERYLKAKEDFKKALIHNPYSVSVLSDMAVTYYYLGDFKRAAELFEESLRIFPMNRTALSGLGMTYVELGRYLEAIECYYRCITDDPSPELDALMERAYAKYVAESDTIN